MATHIYWYAQGEGKNPRIHAVMASTKGIATWYTGSSPMMRGAKFLRQEDRPASDGEGTTVLAHAADKTLRDSHAEWVANGGSEGYGRKLARLIAQIPVSPQEVADEQ
jgi:hypothetical protein